MISIRPLLVGLMLMPLAMAAPGCFPAPLECGREQACPPSTSSCVSTSCEDNVCIEQPITDGTCGADTTVGDAPADIDGDTHEVPLTPPSNVTASTDRVADVELRWESVERASGYHVLRCRVDACTSADDWVELTASLIQGLEYVDAAFDVAAPPPAPSLVDASTDRTNDVSLSWESVSAPASPRYRYRVVSVDASSSSEPSSTVEGGAADRPIIGYEVSIDDGAWLTVPGGLVTSWTDASAPTATLVAGLVTASAGTYPDRVHVGVAGEAAMSVARQYRVRAMSVHAAGAASDEVDGARSAGPLSYQWHRSAGPSADDFAPISGATASSFDDVAAPANGEVRWYRVEISAPAAASVVSEAEPGSRAPPPGIPGTVAATSDEAAHVLVTWQPVAGALGYHVYREGTKLTSGTGVADTSYIDMTAPVPTEQWSAPSDVSASSNDIETVAVAWQAPSRPLGALQDYEVAAVNEAGEGGRSATATGRRAAPALIGFDVEVAPGGENPIWTSRDVSPTAWLHTTAPAPSIAAGTISVSQGQFRARVALASSGASAQPGPEVRYRVRGVLEGGAFTPTSSAAVGRRAVGSLTWQWERSAATDADDFIALTTEPAFDDDDAPADGAKRWYRLVLSATGAEPVTLPAREGWRLAFVAVDGGSNFACALTSAGALWCWGDNTSGQLGRGTTSA